MNDKKKHIFIVGSKSIGQYGGFETFVNKLTEYHQNEKSIQYYVACKKNSIGSMDETKLENVTEEKRDVNGDVIEFKYHNAYVFKIPVPNIGSAEAIYYDIAALRFFIDYCKRNKIEKPIFYILACRIGPFIGHYKRIINKMGGYYCLNPDGHEWKRSKWSTPIKMYWKFSEKLMVKHADKVICDSTNIENYINDEYRRYEPNTAYISYGSDLTKSTLEDDDSSFVDWLNKKDIRVGEYYLMVGRLVPENNYETIIREFMKSNTKRDLVLITDLNLKYIDYLRNKLQYTSDSRIKFVGTVYNQELLKKIREKAFANIHGHEVGGTNPSLLEALGSTKLNLINDVSFNKEVAEDAALYWNKTNDNLSNLINDVDSYNSKELNSFQKKARARIKNNYSWKLISDKYLDLFGKLYNRN